MSAITLNKQLLQARNGLGDVGSWLARATFEPGSVGLVHDTEMIREASRHLSSGVGGQPGVSQILHAVSDAAEAAKDPVTTSFVANKILNPLAKAEHDMQKVLYSERTFQQVNDLNGPLSEVAKGIDELRAHIAPQVGQEQAVKRWKAIGAAGGIAGAAGVTFGVAKAS